MHIFTSLFVLLHAITLASAAACPDPLPTWTVKSLKTTSGTGLTSGKATFDFVDNATNKTEALSCTLRNGYRCEITPASDKAMVLSLQIQIDILYFSVRTSHTCTSEGSTKTILGSGEMELACSEAKDTITCTMDEGVVNAWLD